MQKKNLMIFFSILLIISLLIGIKIYKDKQKEQAYTNWYESTFNQNGITELDKNGVKDYVGKDGIKTLNKTFNDVNIRRIHSAPLNEAQKYLLGKSDKTLSQLDPKELSDAFTLLVDIEPKGTYSLDNFLKWLKDRE